MTDYQTTLGFVPIARPTFDVPLAQAMTQQVRTALADAGFDLIGSDDLIMDADAMTDRIDRLLATPPDLLLVLQSSFADSTMVVHLAQQMDIPLLLWALPEEHTGGRLRLNSFCGINLAAHALKRAGINHYEYVYATPDDPAALAKVRTVAAAAAVRTRLKSARIGRVGENPAGFETCLVNHDMLRDSLGVEVVQIELESVFAGMQTAPAAAVDAALATVGERITGLDSVDSDETRGTLSAYVTMHDMAADQELHGMAVRCWPEFFTGPGCSACGAMSMMTDEHTPTSCEADVNGTITQLILQWLSGEPAFGSDVVSFDVAEDVAILWHCGLAPLSMADPDYQPEAALHSNRQKPLLMQFPLKPGRVTLARLSEATGELRLVIGTGEMIKAPASFSGTSGTLRFDNGAQSALDTIMREGLEHHVSLTYGDYADELVALARMLDVEVLRL